MKLRAFALVGAAAAVLAGCVSAPMGPTVYANPGRSKSPAAFQQDEQMCEDYASQRTAGQAEAANNRAIGSALIGTALGAGLGAAVGGGHGAGIGAAGGAVVGTAVGAGQSDRAQWSLQQRYNVAYLECMQSHGNAVPQSDWPPGYYAPGYAPPPPPPGY